MATASKTIDHPAPPGKLRPFDARRDLGAVADLVETCFADTLDPDGQRYLRQMRSASRNPSLLRWLSPQFANVPLMGYVWEEDGKLVGNISLIPYPVSGRLRYLIANVAVHPIYRRQGIARQLTVQAVQHVRERGYPSVWLHVREQNQAAIDLYQSMAFQERARRTTWFSSTLMPERSPLPGLRVIRRRSSDWPQQREWLREAYPDELTWHLPIRFFSLRPGLAGALYRLMNTVEVEHRAALRNNQLIGVVSWQSTHGFADHVLLAAPREQENEAAFALLLATRMHLSPSRSLALDYPAGRAVQGIRQAGFAEHQTLIWMEKKLK